MKTSTVTLRKKKKANDNLVEVSKENAIPFLRAFEALQGNITTDNRSKCRAITQVM